MADDRVDAAIADSRLLGAARWGDRTLARLLAGSRLVAWLTAEPDPDVIVIDLRETWTVGPVIALLDAVVEPAAERWERSTARRVLRRLGEGVAAAPARLLAVVLLAAAVGLVQAGVVLSGVVVALAGVLAFFERRSLSALGETATGRVLAALFVPPDPEEATPR